VAQEIPDNAHKTEAKADAGQCPQCQIRAFFVSGEWFCTNQCSAQKSESR
jgi:hypothetical protein